MSAPPRERAPWTFWLGLALGSPLMLWGLWNVAHEGNDAGRLSWVKFFIGGDIVHDALIAPVACIVGALVIARVPAVVRAPLRFALFASAVAFVLAWPGLRGYGRAQVPDNRSVEPLHAGTALATVLVVIWCIALVAAGAQYGAARRRRRMAEASQAVPRVRP